MKSRLIKTRLILRGVKNSIPGLRLMRRRTAMAPLPPRYCYSVWLRHLSMLSQHGLNTTPDVVAEIGPGPSLGVGLMALLTGSQSYYALDVAEHTNLEANRDVLTELVGLLRRREDIPADEEFPNLHPPLSAYTFPSDILGEDRLRRGLSEDRIARIRDQLSDSASPERGPVIRYYCPWHGPEVIRRESVDMIFSQAALEHVDDLEHTYQAMHAWLKPGGVMSHEVDFKCHGTAAEFNGHWTYSDLAWKWVKGRDAYLINREPLSRHLELLSGTGFNLISVVPDQKTGGVERRQLSPRFRGLSEEDLTTGSAFLLAVKD